MTHPGATRYSMLDVSEAPEAPGIYAWYAAFRATEQDWQFQPGPTGDEALGPFAELICRYGGQFEPLAVQLSGQGAYGARWRGDLAVDFPFAEGGSSSGHNDGGESAQQTHPRIMKAVETPGARKVVAKLLEHATPTFSTPLYIGVAEDLRRRLTDHKKSYSKAMSWLRDHPEDIAAIKLAGKSFGERAAARNIAMERLEVWVIDLEEELSELSSEQLREMAESAEWILHRIYSPILGRR
ncbi:MULTISPECIES: hypothetical protein [Mycobacterium]|uniref:hypothetical protein n=1 Tax=Mycobacterium TaxID=1763 RepID=UPI001041E4FD|nr:MULTISPECIES: hypothetical protein [Mycobacterium]MCG7607947.1 hypothetical protein [Mycobacterium sp. CnD-18-1]